MRRFRVGEHDRRSSDGDEDDIVVERIFKHPSYNSRVINNDIAVLKLSRSARFGKYVSPACLPQHGQAVPVGTHCYITGTIAHFILQLLTSYSNCSLHTAKKETKNYECMIELIDK